ncbi:glycosyltransferase family 1 protein [Aquimarina aquimarini]|uniref:glycosyltransferase family 1 protein n=1 Tax=Aquimarina aquimarini TaxID=1191734 RepID=UPI000D558621|nr:glycosyltransferase family 1 protein [Aquimarina aquimarini]
MAVFRVLQVFTIMNRGGAESMILNYYRNINREKIQFDFLVFRKEKAIFDDEIESLGGKIYKINAINPLFPGKGYTELRNFFKQHNYTVVHSHLNTFSCFPLKIAKEFNIPCRIAHAHIAMSKLSITSIITGKESFSEGVKKSIKFQLKKRITRYTTHHFSCGEKAGEWLFGKQTPFLTMNNAIDSELFVYNPEQASEYRKKLAIKDEFVIGHVGRFDSQKNHMFLLHIFASLLTLNPNSKLVLIGDGPLRSIIEKEAINLSIEDKVKFLGVQTDIPQWCHMMDAFVFPSLYEGLPVTLIEAQAAGLKVFAADTITDEVCLSDLIEFISLDKSAKYWAEKIVQIDTTTRKNMQSLICDEGYDIKSNAIKMQEFYLQQKHT